MFLNKKQKLFILTCSASMTESKSVSSFILAENQSSSASSLKGIREGSAKIETKTEKKRKDKEAFPPAAHRNDES